ncbi:hypothetical protein OQA88_11452 [Cercophora sp. LCS_1]
MATLGDDVLSPASITKGPAPSLAGIEPCFDFPLPPTRTPAHGRERAKSLSVGQLRYARVERDLSRRISLLANDVCFWDRDFDRTSSAPVDSASERCRRASSPAKEEEQHLPSSAREADQEGTGTALTLSPQVSDRLRIPEQPVKKFSFGSEKSRLDVRQLDDESEASEEQAVTDEATENEIQGSGEVNGEQAKVAVGTGKGDVDEKRGDAPMTLEEEQDRIEPVKEETKDGSGLGVREVYEDITGCTGGVKGEKGRGTEDNGEVVNIGKWRTGTERLRRLCREIRKGARRCWDRFRTRPRRAYRR